MKKDEQIKKMTDSELEAEINNLISEMCRRFCRGCEKADCIYYDHKQYSNNCSASSTQHKLKACRLYQQRKEEVKK